MYDVILIVRKVSLSSLAVSYFSSARCYKVAVIYNVPLYQAQHSLQYSSTWFIESHIVAFLLLINSSADQVVLYIQGDSWDPIPIQSLQQKYSTKK